MTGGGPVAASNTMAVYMIDWGFKRFQFGYASAVAVIMLAISLRVRADLPALRPAARHRGRPDHDEPVKRLFSLYALRADSSRRRADPGRLRGARRLPRPTARSRADPVGLPKPWVFANYREILGSGTFWRQLWNSTLIALVSTLLTVPLAALAAFVFARFAFPGREVLYAVFTLGLLFPVAVAILPIFIMVRNLGLLDNPLGVALPQAAFGLPLTIVILRPFFASFPNELQDAAAIDGCGPFRFFWRILLPLSRPVLATVSRAGDRRLAGTRSCCRSSC